jgi:hypothetical protein
VEHSHWLHGQITGTRAPPTLHIQPRIGHFGAVEVLPDVLSWIVDGISSVERSSFSSTPTSAAGPPLRVGALTTVSARNGAADHS